MKAAMLAGALFNRAGDVFTKIVELQALGVEIRPDNALMQQCEGHLQEALVLGQQVLHRSGEEGIDELWGEPFKAFAFPIEAFYKSRYQKIAHTMRGIDSIAGVLVDALEGRSAFAGIAPRVASFAAAAKQKVETLHTDPEIFDVWATFVAAGEELTEFLPEGASPAEQLDIELGMHLVRQAKEVIFSITRARVPMPKTSQAFIDACAAYRRPTSPVLETVRVPSVGQSAHLRTAGTAATTYSASPTRR